MEIISDKEGNFAFFQWYGYVLMNNGDKKHALIQSTSHYW